MEPGTRVWSSHFWHDQQDAKIRWFLATGEVIATTTGGKLVQMSETQFVSLGPNWKASREEAVKEMVGALSARIESLRLQLAEIATT